MSLRWIARGALVLAAATTFALGALVCAGAFGVGAAAAGQVAPPCGSESPFTNPLTAEPWPLQRLRPEAAWPLSRGAGVTVAVVDDGVTATHEALSSQVLPGRDFVDPGGTGDCDNDGHGTLVASLIAGREVPNFHGIAPDAKILPVKVLAHMEQTDDKLAPKRIADGIRWAADQPGVDVINLSLYTTLNDDLVNAVDYAIRVKNVVVVAASGNTGGSRTATDKIYPAALPGVIAVAGIDKLGARVSTSTAGSFVSIAAPGVNIEGPARVGGGYIEDKSGGTSFAAAYVSGVAALIRAQHKNLPVAEVTRRLIATADPPAGGRNDQLGYGVVNPYRAVSAILAGPSADAAPAAPLRHLGAVDDVTDSSTRVRTIAIVVGILGAVAAFVMVVIVPLVRRLAAAAATGSGSRTGTGSGSAPASSSRRAPPSRTAKVPKQRRPKTAKPAPARPRSAAPATVRPAAPPMPAGHPQPAPPVAVPAGHPQPAPPVAVPAGYPPPGYRPGDTPPGESPPGYPAPGHRAPVYPVPGYSAPGNPQPGAHPQGAPPSAYPQGAPHGINPADAYPAGHPQSGPPQNGLRHHG